MEKKYIVICSDDGEVCTIANYNTGKRVFDSFEEAVKVMREDFIVAYWGEGNEDDLEEYVETDYYCFDAEDGRAWVDTDRQLSYKVEGLRF